MSFDVISIERFPQSQTNKICVLFRLEIEKVLNQDSNQFGKEVPHVGPPKSDS